MPASTAKKQGKLLYVVQENYRPKTTVPMTINT